MSSSPKTIHEIESASMIPACASALKFAASQTDDPEWLAVGLTTALKAALMATLSAYENAEDQDIQNTERDGAASIRLLLRRASSADYLAEEHRLHLTSAKRKALLKLVAVRNQTLHILPDSDSPPLEDVPRLALIAVDVIEHLTLVAPAFNVTRCGVDLALIADYVRIIRSALEKSS